MAIPNGLLSNPVISGLLGRGGPAGIKAQKDAELAAMRRGVQGGRIPAPGAARPVAVDSLGRGLSSLGASLQGIADMRKARAKRQAIIDSRAPITTTERVMTEPKRTVNVPGQFNEIPNMNRIDVTPDGIPKAVDATARAQEFLKEEDDPYAQRIGEQALVALNNAAEPGLPPAPSPETPTNADDISAERDRQIATANTIRQQDNEQAAELLGLQYTPGFQKVVAEKYEDQKRTRTPTLYESADKLLAGGYITEAAKLASIASTKETTKTSRIKALADLKKAQNTGTLVPGSEKYLKAVDQLTKSFQKSEDVSKYRDSLPNFKAMELAFDRAMAGDNIAVVDMVFAIAKLYDPGSVVREGEFITIRDAGGLPSQLVGAIGKIKGDTQLDQKTLRNLLQSGRDRMKTYEPAYRASIQRQQSLAKKYNMSLMELDVRPDDKRFLSAQNIRFSE